MSISSDGIFFYGLCWAEEDGLRGVLYAQDGAVSDEDSAAEDADEEFADRLCRLLGGPADIPMPEGEETETDRAARWARTEARDAARDAFLVDKIGVALRDVLHCSYDYEMFGIAVASTYRVASRGGPVHLGMELQAAPPGSDTALRKACEALGIDFEKAVADGCLGWWLTSLYG